MRVLVPEKYIPRYAKLPLLIAAALNFAVYYGSRIFDGMMPAVNILLPPDYKIPLFPPMIVVYVLSYLFWIVNYILIARESPENCRYVLHGEWIAKIICMFCFILIPTAMPRPVPQGNDIFSAITRIIYSLDEPTHLLPSIHCLESWLCWRGLFGCKKVSRGYKAFSLIFAVSVFASTLLVRQHAIIDIPAALLAAEIGLWGSRALTAAKRKA